jgi:type I restriction-modification system DNA methylase subunit
MIEKSHNDSNYESCLSDIIRRIEVFKQPLTNQELFAVCRQLADFLRDEVNPHFVHELAETALNFLILTKYAKPLLCAENPREVLINILRPLISRLPTQTWRSREQNSWQQFSTPPAMAYLLTYLLNLQMGEKVLEPSAGTGSLAVWSVGSGLQTHTN